MPTINRAAVISATHTTGGNGGRKLVRLANGNLVAAVITDKTSNGGLYKLLKSTDNGVTWSTFYTSDPTGAYDVAIVPIGNDVGVVNLWRFSSGDYRVRFRQVKLDGSVSQNLIVENSQYEFNNGISFAVNESGTELHAVWSSKNASYPSVFNIRYTKGTITESGTVNWTTVTQLTKMNDSNYADFALSPTIEIVDGEPVIAYQSASSLTDTGAANNSYKAIMFLSKTNGNGSVWVDNAWRQKSVVSVDQHAQSSPSMVYIPPSVNQLPNGRIFIAWHGRVLGPLYDQNIYVSHSDDRGSTWTTPTALTTGTTYEKLFVSLGADQSGKVFALYQHHEWSPDLDIWMRTYESGSWGAPTSIVSTEPRSDHSPSTLVDFSLQMTVPPFVYTEAGAVKFAGTFYTGASVTPATGSIGNKETPIIASYTVAPEPGTTVTQIIERVNGTTVNTYNNPASLTRTFTVPLNSWGALDYWGDYTAEVRVMDSNGIVSITTYSFKKTLPTNAPLLDTVKANNDATNRISQKRDVIAAQVGLPTGSTFDAISAQLSSGVLPKIATGQLTSSSSLFNMQFVATSYTSLPKVEFTGLGFKAKYIYLISPTKRDFAVYSIDSDGYQPDTVKLSGFNTGNANTFTSNLMVNTMPDCYVNDTGFSLPVLSTSSNYNFIAFGN